MFFIPYTFQYNPENLQEFSYIFTMDNLTVPMIVLGTLLVYGCIYFLAPHIYSFIVARAQKQEKDAKRNIIKDLILMKEIQGELEKEIEQSLLNITLQGKGV
ncbi:MAG: hypothetical protein PHQ95_03160 [Candidatus Gracilibacteria bacterium]|nr:hypothetical protein [Candidatus Gracilibacteria bacterium]